MVDCTAYLGKTEQFRHFHMVDGSIKSVPRKRALNIIPASQIKMVKLVKEAK
jgi:hypothetical protein